MLLPSKFQPESLPSLGKLVAKAIAPKPVDPIKAFEIGDHGSKSAAKWTYAEIIGAAFLRLSDGTCSANGAALIGFNPSPQAEQPAPFKVGDAVRSLVSHEEIGAFNVEVGDLGVVADVLSSTIVARFGADKWQFSPWQLAPSQEAAKGDAEGWIAHRPGDPCPIPGVRKFEVRFSTPFREKYEEERTACLLDVYWTGHEDYRQVVAYRVLP